MRQKTQEILFRLSYILEVLISLIIVVAIMILGIKLAIQVPVLAKSQNIEGDFALFLSTCFSLIIGIELVKMLVKHSLTIAVEVLVFSLARQMVVKHLSAVETLITIFSLAGLFAIRMWLIHREKDKVLGELKPLADKENKVVEMMRNDFEEAVK
ncbi:uncharacterized membrane protein (DUF373 family) [Aequitasia blattaphilus]|uniref:Transporter n=1 Tax=Aequitasia blattaphilus TaxID=2949332 RepID=A0ABT1ED15_9FIRM|nr:transporter [Aequitasia blattaphilus]MCP1103729.1 transporter [Aequitasia blattaphilus]MCR8616369.1 transporter [Aequitasia blattaphilus]